MEQKIKIDLLSFGHTGLYYRALPATAFDIDVDVVYPSGRCRSYVFSNYAKACAFVGRTLAKHPSARCSVSVPCQTVMYDFSHNRYRNSKPTPAVKRVILSMYKK